MFFLLFNALFFFLHYSVIECSNFATYSNYKLSQLKNFVEEHKCKTNEDCPTGGECVKGKYHYHCRFNGYLCPGDEQDYCLFFNRTIWDYEQEQIRPGFDDIEQIPILKTCDRELAQKDLCKTKECAGNYDCASNSCYNGTCISRSVMYICLGEEIDLYNKHYFKCGKHLHMKCTSPQECYSNECTNGYCSYTLPSESVHFFSPLNVCIMLSVIVIGLLGVLFIKRRKDPSSFMSVEEE